MKRRQFAILPALVLALCLGLCRGVCALEAEAEAPYDGYIVKLRPEFAASVFSGSGEAIDPYLTVETLEEALEFPEELVAYIEPNYLVELFTEPDPNSDPDPEPDIPVQGYHDPYYADYQWSLQAIHAWDAYRLGLTGKGVKVGFVDSGVNRAHEDLKADNIGGMSFLDGDTDFGKDTIGHGTFTTGIVASQSNNGLGLAGLAPDVSLRAYRAFDQKTGSALFVARAIRQAVADGCQVLNLSLGMTMSSETLREAVEEALAAGVIVIAAAGNDGIEALQYPAAYDGVIGVGSVDRDLTVSFFSQRNESVDFTAPGGGVAGLDYITTDGYRLDLNASTNRGTSYAAPVITALAALALGCDPDISPEGVFALLKASAVDLGEPGYDTSYGFGLADAGRLAEALERIYSIEYRLGADEAAELPENAPDAYKMYLGCDLPVPVRPGYRFAGWYEDENCRGLGFTSMPIGTEGEKVLYAGWVPEDLDPRACLAEYDARGRMISLEWLTPDDLTIDAASPESERIRRLFWIDGDFRPLLPSP